MISYFGEYHNPTTDDANSPTGPTVSLTPPADMRAGDFVLVSLVYRGQVTWTNSTSGGQTWSSSANTQSGTTNTARLFWCVFNGTWSADPVFTVTTGTSGAQGWMVVFRGVDNLVPWDVTPVLAAQTASLTYTIATFSTNTPNAWAMVGASSQDDNTWSVDNSFVHPSGSGQIYWRSAAGQDNSLVIVRREFASAGAVGQTVMTQDTLGADLGVRWYGALKAAATGFAQAQASIKTTSYPVAQANAAVKITSNTYGQAQAAISVSYRSFAQAQSQIKSINFASAQAQAGIKAVSSVHAQAQADIKQIYNGHGQAGANITQSYQGYAQTSTNIKATYTPVAQSQSQIKQVYTASAQAQADILITAQGYSQAQGHILATERAYGQAQAEILSVSGAVNGYAQALAQIGRSDDLYTAIDEASYDDNDYILSPVNPSSRIYEALLTDINEPSYRQDHIIRFRSFKVGTQQITLTVQLRRGATIIAQTSQILTSSAQTYEYQLIQSEIDSIPDYADLRLRFIADTDNNGTDSKAIVTWTELQLPSGPVKIRRAFGQAQAEILLGIYRWNFAQAQASIRGAFYQNAQAQADIKVTYQGYSNAQAHIKAIYTVSANAQASILQTYTVSANAQAEIKQVYQVYAQAQAVIVTTNYSVAQAQASIKSTIFEVAQAQANIKRTYFDNPAQAQAQIKQFYSVVAQANAKIKLVIDQYAQAQANIVSTTTIYAQAQAYIKSTALFGHANAQANILATVNAYAQSQADIKQVYENVAQAQAYILIISTVSGQAQAQILTTYIALAQAQAEIIKATAYGQAQAFIRIDHIFGKIQISDQIGISLSLTDRSSTEDISDLGSINLTLSDRESISLTLSDQIYNLTLGDINY